jgi:hypothetical protein
MNELCVLLPALEINAKFSNNTVVLELDAQ